MSRTLETADAVPSRVHSAAVSMSRWYRRELRRIEAERRLFRQELSGTADPAHTAELRAALNQNEAEEAGLHAGWENSSVRRAIQRPGEVESSGLAEMRFLSGLALSPPAAVRADTGTSRLTAKSLTGYAAVFNRFAELGFFKEKIAPGAFAKALRKSDTRLLFNHDSNHLFGRSSAATLELAEDSIGLRFVGYLLPFDPACYALARRVVRGDISGCSFSFIIGKDEWKLARRPGDIDERTILEIDELWDVGPVTFPAYPQTSVQAFFEQLPSRSMPAVSDINAWTDDDEQEWQQIVGEAAERKHRQRRAYHQLGAMAGRNRSAAKVLRIKELSRS